MKGKKSKTENMNSNNKDTNSLIENSVEEETVSPIKKRKLHNEKKIENAEIARAKSELYKPPTVEELNQLRETEILFNSNIFRLQTEELLKEVLIKQKRKTAYSSWLENFEEFTNNLPEHDVKLSDFNVVIDVTNSTKKKKIIKQIAQNNPLTLKTDQDAQLKLLKPVSIQTVGLYNVNAVVGPNLNITLNVIIPKGIFQGKDYLNARYLVKRGLYLSYLATHLKDSQLLSSATYTYLYGNSLIPILSLVPNNMKNTTISILVTPEDNTFKDLRFLPNKCNVRCSYFNNLYPEVELSVLEPNDNWNSPFYNAVIQNDLTLNANDKFRRESIENMKGACDGLILLSVWLRQRELCNGFGGFTEDLMYSLIVFLANVGKINKHMSSYQVIRNVWNHLANCTWDTQGISLMSGKNTDIQLYHAHYDVVFVDRTGYYNLAANLEINIFFKIKQEASLALNCLDEGKINSFQALFMTKMNFYLQYDSIINIPNSHAWDKIYDSVNDKKKVDYLNFGYPLVVNQITETLKKGLSDRIVCIVPKLKPNIIWQIGEEPINNDWSITFGVQFDMTNMFKVIDKGPPAYDPLAANFRQFWGEKADLRRFKDGSICEAVYWPATNIQDKRKICKSIIEYVLENKLNVKTFSIVYDQFGSILETYKTPAIEEGNMKIINIFDELVKKLRGLNLPLNISTVQGVSDAFCHTDAYPPAPTNYKCGKKVTYETDNNILFLDNIDLKVAPKYVVPVEGVIQMGHHSKWPNNLTAVCKLKTAFYIQISELLKKTFKIRCNPKNDNLDILYNGLIFRLVLFHPKQISLLKKHTDERGVVTFTDTDESIIAEQKYVVMPKIIGALNGIHSQYPSYGPSTVLIKRWLNSQLIDESHISNVTINLLNASLYLNSAPFSHSVLPQVAFLRFLRMLVSTTWNLQMIVVNFNDEIKQLDEAESNFQQNREDFPPMYIITPYDTKSLVTQYAPSKEILHRLYILAKESLAIIEKNLYSQHLFNVKTLFRPNLSGYNVIIHLQPFLNPRRHEFVFNDKEIKAIPEYEENVDDKIPVVNFNPVELYLKELRDNYDEFALFFHDTYGGSIIAVLWKPAVFSKEDLKVSQVGGKMLTSKDKLQCNIDAIIEDFYILGSGLINTIEKT